MRVDRFVLGAVAILGVGLLACRKNKEQPPGDVPIYPGAKQTSGIKTLGVINAQYNTTDDGEKVKAFYSSHMPAAYQDRFIATWRTRRELAGMRFDYRVYQSKSRGDYVQVEVAHRPGQGAAVLKIKYCPPNRPAHCVGK